MLWIAAAPGPSLTPEVAELCRGKNVIAVNDAYKRVPFARCLYAADWQWWKARQGAPDFDGERWIVRVEDRNAEMVARREEIIRRYRLRVIDGIKRADGFSLKGGIHLGGNSGFQAVNLALRFGGDSIILVGFDMAGTHFFGPHLPPLRSKQNFGGWIKQFEKAASMLPAGIRIINATPGSALKCFPIMTLGDALNASRET
jgi:hypothetical protein